MNPQRTLWGDELHDDFGPHPKQYARALRVLLDAWQEAVLTDPATTPAYRADVREAVGDAHAALDEGASPYYTLILTVGPLFAATDEELATLIELPDDPEEAAEVRRRVQAGDVTLR